MSGRNRAWLFAGLATFLVALVVLFPARVAYRMASVPGVAVAGIDGSVWHGSARELNAGGTYLQNVAWQFKPLGLFTGKLVYDIEAQPVSGFAEARVGIGPGGNLLVRDFAGSVPLRIFAGAFNVPGLDGSASVRMAELRVRDGLPVAANGTVEIGGLIVPLVDPNSIGGDRAEFVTTDAGVIASVEDTDGLFDIAATLTVAPDRSYQLLGKVAPKPRTPEKLRRQLQMLGSPDAEGKREIRLEGAL